jgi:DNA-binding NarL/FixJ family response regulator
LSWSITFDVEVFAISQNQNSDVGISLIRMVQRWGSVDSFAKIGQLIENFMRKQAVLVTDKAEAAEIKAAIFKGLQGVLPPPRTG